MAATAAPLPHREPPARRPNVPSAAVRLPAVRDYEQVDREIIGNPRPSLAWFVAPGIAVTCLVIGAPTGTYQIHEGLGAPGYHPPTMGGA